MRGAAIFVTWFGSGWLPWAPGSWGSLAALPFAWALVKAGGPGLLAFIALSAFALGCWAADIALRETQTRDPGWIVIDEVVGQWLTLLAAPASLAGYASGFVLFRLFDIWKPWPVSLADRKLEGGFGVMADDVLAAIYAALVLLAGRYLFER
ncbi:MAG TPA: phosphatidylglycerophosphatase A [Stellaceae bacterium]|nr:phosphatidylglycerophosphatase A [Stellaceae bacterium]